MSEFAVLTTSVPALEMARSIARALVERGLAGWVQVSPVRSIYRWDGAIEEGEEHLLTCKIRQADFAAVEAAIRALHPYEVPEILAVPVTGINAAYAAWLRTATER